LSTMRVYYDAKCKQVILGSSSGRQIRSYQKISIVSRISSRITLVYGKVLELPEEYFIAHYGSRGSISDRKMVFYALLEFIEYYKYPFIRLLIVKKALWWFPPFSLPLIIESILMQFRSRKRSQISRLVLRYGLIRLLKPDKLRTYGKVLVRC